MKDEKYAAAERVLASLPKRAGDLSREELVDLVNEIQVILYTATSVNGNPIKEDGVEVWDPNRSVDGADFVEAVDASMTARGLRPGEEFKDQKVVHP